MFQTKAAIIILLALKSATLLLHALPYLLLYPDYNCFENDSTGRETSMGSYECIPSNFCGNPNIRTEKVDSKQLLQNWVQDFDLICVNQSVILAFYLVILAGLALGGLILAPLTDSYGKKNFFVASLIAILVVYVLILLATDYSHIHFYLLFYGMALAVSMISGILWVLQLMPK